MSFESYYNLVSYLTLTMGFVTLVLTGYVGIETILLGVFVLTTSWLTDFGKLKWRLPAGSSYLAVLAVPLFFVDWQFISGSPIGALVRLILLLSVFKLYAEKKDRDWLFLYSLSMFQMLLAASLSISISYMALLITYILLLLLTLTASEIRRAKRTIEPVGEIEVLSSKVRYRPGTKIVNRLIRVSFVLLVLSLVLATPLFIFMPRPYGGLLGQLGNSTQALSGFSDSVSLGDVASLKKNPQVVMHVKVEGAESRILPRLKWRGIALDYYDGEKWQNSFVSRQHMRGQGEIYQVDYGLSQEQSAYIKQTFFVEPVSTPVMFAAWRPVSVQVGIRRVMRDPTASLYTDDHSTSRITYSVNSDGSVPRPELLREARTVYPSDERRYYLQLPNIDPRVKQLALQITRGATNNYDRAKLIENYLRTEYGYTLEVPRTNEPDPLVDFLFYTKKGYCQYFATAMAVMLRSINIPARVVNGFQAGDYNPMIGSFVVRQSDAHSWVEAYFPLNGPESAQWVEFDPTPPAGQNVYEAGFLTSLSRFADALEFFWQQHVISYDSQQQVKVWDRVERQLSSWKTNVTLLFHQVSVGIASLKTSGDTAQTLVIIVAFLVVLAFVTVAMRKAGWLPGAEWWRLLLRLNGKSSYRESAFTYYNEMQQLLAQRGLTREPGQTPMELALNTGFDEAVHITTIYNRARFSGAEVKPEDVKSISGWLTQLRARLAEMDKGSKRSRMLRKVLKRRIKDDRAIEHTSMRGRHQSHKSRR